MMDEQLIDEVALHAVIYNRQKYYLNGSVNGQTSGALAANKYETKDEAWQNIAMKLRSDVETCKKRWKYLRERYVSQRKQGDPPVYEHLSRPYLEKMKFLDSHIQPRKSYRNVPNYLTSPHSGNGSNFNDYNMDSKSNSSLKGMGHFGQHHPFQDQQHAMSALSSALEGEGRVKLESDVLRDFAAAVASQQLQQISQTPMHHQQAALAALAADPSQSYNEHFRDAASSALSAVVASAQHNGNGIHSSSSSIKSPLSSPLGATQNGTHSAGHSSSTSNHQSASNVHHNASSTPVQSAGGGSSNNNHYNNHSFNESQEDMDSSASSNYTKKPRVQLNNSSAETQQHNNGISHSNHSSSLAGNAAHTSNNHHQQQQHSNSNHLNNSNNSQFCGDESDDDSDENSASILQPQTILNEHPTDNPFNSLAAASPAPSNASSSTALQRSNSGHLNSNTNNANQAMFSSNADFLFQLYQQLPQHNQQNSLQQQQQFSKFQVPPTPAAPVQRSSEHLLGELVTTELLKMSKERRKNVQKRILEILFFDD